MQTRVPRQILVTGGAGFIGANFVHHLLRCNNETHVLIVDALTYAGSLANLEGLDAGRYTFIQEDIRDHAAMTSIFSRYEPDTVVNFAAESHVDRSIDGPLGFVETNVLGTAVLLEAARMGWKDRDGTRFHHVSTDEVYGSLGPEGRFSETSPIRPSSPYSASKAGADHLVNAYRHTYGMDVTISNCSNNYGPRQFPEKLIPLILSNALADKPLPVYGKGENIRDWLHVDDHAAAILAIITRGEPGRTYNVGGDEEWTNIDLVRALCRRLDEIRPRADGRYEELISFVPDRPGHDARYAVDSSRIRSELGWAPARSFEEGLDQTIRWYLDNGPWLDRIRTEKYGGERLGLS